MSSPGASSTALAEWEHHTAAGIEYGGSVPTGHPPSALDALIRAGRRGWEHRRLVWLLAINDYTTGYRAQSLGMFWSIANPLISMLTMTVAFTVILQIAIPNFMVFIFSGMIFWQFFTGSVSGCTSAFTSKAGLIRGTNFPRYLVPLIVIVKNLISFGMEFILLYLFFFIFPDAFTFSLALLFLPVLLVLLTFMTYGVGLFTASLNVRYRDTQYVVGAVLGLAFWMTPILYATSMAPPWIARWLRLNPLAGIVEGARSCVMDGRLPSLELMVPTLVATVVLFALGALVYRRESVLLADYL